MRCNGLIVISLYDCSVCKGKGTLFLGKRRKNPCKISFSRPVFTLPHGLLLAVPGNPGVTIPVKAFALWLTGNRTSEGAVKDLFCPKFAKLVFLPYLCTRYVGLCTSITAYFTFTHKKQTPMTHGHEVLAMMEGNSYPTKDSLVKAIVEKFGSEERFYTCSADNLTASQLVDFLEEHGKFMPAGQNAFTVDTSKVCNH